MMRLAAALLVRIGLVLLILAVLVRLLPMPSQADVVADDFAIAVSAVLVLVGVLYLLLTRDTTKTDGTRGLADLNTMNRASRRHG